MHSNFLIDNINLLVEYWTHHRFNLKSIRGESMDGRAPALRNRLSVLGVLRYVAGIVQADRERKVSSLYYRIFPNPRRLNQFEDGYST